MCGRWVWVSRLMLLLCASLTPEVQEKRFVLSNHDILIAGKEDAFPPNSSLCYCGLSTPLIALKFKRAFEISGIMLLITLLIQKFIVPLLLF